jgi:cbb3-type cytochrome oxidase subunit 3
MDLQEIHSLLSSLWVVWFTVVFLGIVVWAFRPSKRGSFESYGRIPLRDDE